MSFSEDIPMSKVVLVLSYPSVLSQVTPGLVLLMLSSSGRMAVVQAVGADHFELGLGSAEFD